MWTAAPLAIPSCVGSGNHPDDPSVRYLDDCRCLDKPLPFRVQPAVHEPAVILDSVLAFTGEGWHFDEGYVIFDLDFRCFWFLFRCFRLLCCCFAESI